MILLAKISFQLDSTLPKDAVTINPCYNGDDPQALADRLKANLIALAAIGNAVPFTIKVYNAMKEPPNYPLASASNGTGSAITTIMREAALCLSYYSVANRPGQRGRLYIPAFFSGGGLGLRPSTVQQQNALLWGPAIGKNLPTNTTWAVHSRKHDTSSAAVVTNYYVNDEWDIVRSRGLRETARQLGTVP